MKWSVKMNQIWSDAERNFVRDNAGVLTDEQGAAQLSRITGRDITMFAYRKQRQAMKIVKKQGRSTCQVDLERTVEKGGTYVSPEKVLEGVKDN
jgi:hypothetical protein